MRALTSNTAPARAATSLLACSFVCALLLMTACASSPASQPALSPTPSSEATAAPQEPESDARSTIVVPLSLHVAIEAGVPDSELSSMRTVDEVALIAAAISEIWAQADIVFDPINVHQVEVPTAVLQGILLGNTEQFFAQVNTTFAVENGQAINGFFVRSAFGVNGFNPQGSNLFFVVDEPSVLDERVSSHELGHVFGLHHDLVDASQLMFSGTNGVGLSELEQTVARYTALGLFPQVGEP